MLAYDSLALSLSHQLIDSEMDLRIPAIMRSFTYLVIFWSCHFSILRQPLEHSENLNNQALSVIKFQQLYKDEPSESPYKSIFKLFFGYAEGHHLAISKFGRFPHRNKLLGRLSPKEEVEYLNSKDFFGNN